MTAMDWKHVVRAVQRGLHEDFRRAPADIVTYERYNAGLRQSWRSVGDFILRREFGASVSTDEASGCKYVKEVPEEQTRISRNDFAYNLAPGIEHWLVWATFRLDKVSTLDAIDHWLAAQPIPHSQFLSPLCPDDLDPMIPVEPYIPYGDPPAHVDSRGFVFFVNPPSLQSVRNVSHAHLFFHLSPDYSANQILPHPLHVRMSQ